MVLRLRIPSINWGSAGARCVHHARPHIDDDPWFDPAQYPEVLGVCNGNDVYDGPCPARDYCLRFACVNNESAGTWGGMLPHDRHKLRQEAKATGIPLKEVNWEWHPPTEPDAPEEEILAQAADEDDDLP
ncbi:WhiB family transcriptional regulator [Nonomuraea sp. SYSU D8015]|uniref:WhiB family transcriptional regulator n=1 Tax=Nonomuraea sp. SYSU D8015 TaxID=2593644 RepID=UPI003FA5CB90